MILKMKVLEERARHGGAAGPIHVLWPWLRLKAFDGIDFGPQAKWNFLRVRGAPKVMAQQESVSEGERGAADAYP